MEADSELWTNAAIWLKPKTEDGEVVWDCDGTILEPITWLGLEDDERLEHWTISRDDEMFENILMRKSGKIFGSYYIVLSGIF